MATDRGTLSGFILGANVTETKPLARPGLAHSYSQHLPEAGESTWRSAFDQRGRTPDRLLGLDRTAEVHPIGIATLRSGPSGRLTFFSNQVVAWVIAQQQKKGGNHR